MDTRFRGVCEEAAERWSVPALAVGVSVGGEPETLALGCDPGTRFRIASAVFDGVEYAAEAIGERTFQIAAGDRIGERFDFPREGLARFGSRLAARVA